MFRVTVKLVYNCPIRSLNFNQGVTAAGSKLDLTKALVDLNKRHIRDLAPVSRKNERCTSQQTRITIVELVLRRLLADLVYLANFTIKPVNFIVGETGSITRGWKEEVSCTRGWLCVLGFGKPRPMTQNHSQVQDTSSFHPLLMEPLFLPLIGINTHLFPMGIGDGFWFHIWVK